MNTSQIKKVSVVVPNYNYARYLRRRIKSITRQSYPIYELIILDDASTDESDEIIREEIAKMSVGHQKLKIRYVRNELNSGKVIKQWKKGFELASGDYIWIAEADDSSKKNFLSEVMKGFNDPDVVISYAESKIINSKGIMIAPNFRWSRDKEKTGHYSNSYVVDGESEIKEIMSLRCTIPNVSAVVFKKSKRIPYLKYLDEAERFSQVGDWFFYVNVLRHGKISYCRRSLNVFRIHKGSKTKVSNGMGIHYKELLWMHEMFRSNYNLDEKIKERMLEEERRIRKKHGIIE